MKFKLLLLPEIFNNRLLKKVSGGGGGKQDNQLLARLMFCRSTSEVKKKWFGESLCGELLYGRCPEIG